MSRHDEIREGLGRVRSRIAAACDDAGRDADEVTLVVVTKLSPRGAGRAALSLNMSVSGESRALMSIKPGVAATSHPRCPANAKRLIEIKN